MRISLFLLGVLAYGQTSTPPTPAKSSPQFVVVGGSFSDPGWSSFACYATPLNSGVDVYSYSCYDALIAAGKLPAVTMETGAASQLKAMGPVSIWALVQAGVATSQTATTKAITGGGFVKYTTKVGSVVLGVDYNNASGTTKAEYKIGWVIK